jgi:hypothetical protein
LLDPVLPPPSPHRHRDQAARHTYEHTAARVLIEVARALAWRGAARPYPPGGCALCGLSLESVGEMRSVRAQPTTRAGLLGAAPPSRPVAGQEGPGLWHTLRGCGCMVCAACLAEWLDGGGGDGGDGGGGGGDGDGGGVASCSPSSIIPACRRAAALAAATDGGGDPLGVAEDDLHLEGLPCPSCGCYLDGRTFTCRTQGKFVQGMLALKGWPLDYAPVG